VIFSTVVKIQKSYKTAHMGLATNERKVKHQLKVNLNWIWMDQRVVLGSLKKSLSDG
jgi:hypothetical protein